MSCRGEIDFLIHAAGRMRNYNREEQNTSGQTLTFEEVMEDFLTFDFFTFSASLSPEVERILEFLRLSTLELRVFGLLFGTVALLAGF